MGPADLTSAGPFSNWTGDPECLRRGGSKFKKMLAHSFARLLRGTRLRRDQVQAPLKAFAGFQQLKRMSSAIRVELVKDGCSFFAILAGAAHRRGLVDFCTAQVRHLRSECAHESSLAIPPGDAR